MLEREIQTANSHKKACEELVTAYKAPIQAAATEILLREKGGEDLQAENEKLKTSLKILYKASLSVRMKTQEVNEEKTRVRYEEELRRKDAYNAQLVSKLQELIRAITTSEKFYETFSTNSNVLLQYMNKFTEEQRDKYLFSSSDGEKSAEEGETEMKSLKETVTHKEEELERVRKELKFWQGQSNYYNKWAEEMQKQLSQEKTQRLKELEQLRATLKNTFESELEQEKARFATLNQQYIQIYEQLNKYQELEKMYAEQTRFLKEELAMITLKFEGMRKEIIETGVFHNVFCLSKQINRKQ